jgi:hypothetical protein
MNYKLRLAIDNARRRRSDFQPKRQISYRF